MVIYLFMNREREIQRENKLCRLTFIKVNFWSSCKAGDFFICGTIAVPCARTNDDYDLIDKYVFRLKTLARSTGPAKATHRMLFTMNIDSVQFGNKTSFQ